MGTGVSDPVREHQPQPSPKTNRQNLLLEEMLNDSVSDGLFLPFRASSLTCVIMSNPNLLQVAQIHSLHNELIDHPQFKLILVVLTRLEVDGACGGEVLLISIVMVLPDTEEGVYRTGVVVFTKQNGKDIGIGSSVFSFPGFNFQSVCG